MTKTGSDRVSRWRRGLFRRGLFDQAGDDRGLVPLRPVGCVVDKMEIRLREQPSQMTSQAGSEVFVGRAENQRDRDVEARQVTGGDVRVLPIERGKRGRGPGPDRHKRVGLGLVVEELRCD
jgi:hypothetical protein